MDSFPALQNRQLELSDHPVLAIRSLVCEHPTVTDSKRWWLVMASVVRILPERNRVDVRAKSKTAEVLVKSFLGVEPVIL